MVVLYRVIAVVIGYIFGLFQTGYIYGKRKGIDIREHGSSNSGTTNTLRTLGIKAGLITFAGDCLKAIVAMAVVWAIFHGIAEDWIKVLCLYAGFGAVLGHNFPVYLKFKGGKGIACTAGVVIGICPLAVPVCFLAFILIVLITRYVSLGSIVGVLLFLLQIFVFYRNGILGVSGNYANEFVIITICFTLMAIIRHRTNIVRLLNGTENKIHFSKSDQS